MGRIVSDQKKFKEIVEGCVRSGLRKYITHGDIILPGKSPKEKIIIPIPHLDIPRFKYETRQLKGIGQGDGNEGDPLGGDASGEKGRGKAGDQPGEHPLEAEFSVEDLARMLGEELELPNIEKRGQKTAITHKNLIKGISKSGPQSLRHFKRTYREALKRQISSGIYNPNDPLVVPIKDDKRYRALKTIDSPETNAVLFHMMDVSGSVDDEDRRRVARISFWIDAWLSIYYTGLENVFLVHDTKAKEVDRDTFFRISTGGGTKISSVFDLGRRIIRDAYPPEEWNIYLFYYTDGDNWSSDDDELCVKMLKDDFLPVINLFCSGRLANSGSRGDFFDYLRKYFREEEKITISDIEDDESIIPTIERFLGKGK